MGGAHRGVAIPHHGHRVAVRAVRVYPTFRYYYPGYGYGYYYPGYYPLGYDYDYDYVPNPLDPDVIPVPADTPEKEVLPMPKKADNIGYVQVRVPADAKVWVDDQATRQTGTDREFQTPPLRPGSTYMYSLKAQWTKDGQTVERTQQVRVKANSTAKVDFTTLKE
jgi:uncharacterized protein (TIGR03000 family)